jgi:hypothetical protein
MTLISETHAWGSETLEQYDQDEHDAIRGLLLGHKVEKIADDHLRLDDGTVLKVVPNEGGCSCSAGDYELTDLNDVDNIITAVEFVQEDLSPDDKWSDAYSYRLFVIAEDKKLKLLQVDGDDGNGYYGTGYTILVRPPS